MLVQRAKSGDLHVNQHATWGMSVSCVASYIIRCKKHLRIWLDWETVVNQRMSNTILVVDGTKVLFMKPFLNLLYVSAFLALAACVSPDPLNRIDSLSIAHRSKVANSGPLLTAYVSGKTIWDHSDPQKGGHGSQIEYHAADGRSFLWYPGNQRPVQGRWKVEQGQSGVPLLCYQYGANTYNPVLGTRGGAWKCERQNWVSLGDAFEGDPFRLASGRVPFVIPDRAFYTPDRLLSMAGRSGETVTWVTDIEDL
jgi:hypothetical protein